MKEILITSSAMIAALLLLRLVFAKKVSRRLIYGVWILVALRLLIPVQIGQMDFSILTAAQPLTETVTEIEGLRIIGQNEREAETQVITQYIENDLSIFTPEMQAIIQSGMDEGRPAEEIAVEISKVYSPEDTYVPGVQAYVQQQVAQQTNFVSIGQFATILWLAGVAVMAAWFFVVNLRYGRMLRLNREQLACESPIPVYVSNQVDSPCLCGLIRPVAYVTPACAENPEMLHHVLTHELTHYAHRDHIWSLVRCVCLCVYWFNPLVWIGAGCCRRDCELACDEGALKRLEKDEHLAYGQTLLDVVRQANAPSKLMQTATSMNESKKQLKERVNFIVKKPKISIIAAISMVLVCAIVTSCVATGPSGGTNATVQTKPYIAIQSVDNKLAIVYEETLILTEYTYYSSIGLTMSLDGKSAVCRAGGPLLYIHGGTVREIVAYADSYSFSVSGNAIAFHLSEINAARANLKSGLYLYRQESGQIQQVAATVDGEIQDYAISPDGHTLAYLQSSNRNRCVLMLHQNGTSTVRFEFESNNGYRLISIDNSTDVIYLRARNHALTCINKAGQQTKIGKVDRYLTEYNDPTGYLYLNADHTQLLFNGYSNGTYLSNRGQEAVQVSTYGLRPMQPALSCFHFGRNTITCDVGDMKEQIMLSASTKNGWIQVLRGSESGQYVFAGECEAAAKNCWLDPSGRYVFSVNKNQQLYCLDLQSGGEPTLLAESVDCYAVSYDCSTFHYGNRYLYDYEDGLQKYGGNLYTCNTTDGTELDKIQTEVLKGMYFSENNQLFYLVYNDGRNDLYTLTAKGKPKLVMEDVKQFVRSDCGMLFVEAGDGHYIIRGGELTELEVKTFA